MIGYRLLNGPAGSGFESPVGHHLVDFTFGCFIFSLPGDKACSGRLAQLGERLPYKQDVGSSILSSSTKLKQLSSDNCFFVL